VDTYITDVLQTTPDAISNTDLTTALNATYASINNGSAACIPADQVSACAGKCTGDSVSDQCSGTYSCTSPAFAPNVSGLSVTGGVEQASLSWIATAAATGYDICYSLTSTACTTNFTPSASSGTNSATISGLTGNTTYYFAIKAKICSNTVYSSAPSSEVSATPSSACTPTAQETACANKCSGETVPNGCSGTYTCSGPASISDVSGLALATYAGQANLSWNSVTYATSAISYDICYSTNSTACTTNFTPNTTAATSTKIITGLSGASTYYFTVKAKACSNTAASANASNQVSSCVPSCSGSGRVADGCGGLCAKTGFSFAEVPVVSTAYQFANNDFHASANGGVIYVTDNAAKNILRSTDFGLSWTKLNFGPDPRQIAVSSDGSVVYATKMSDNKLYYSTDQGVNWLTKTMPLTTPFRVSVSSNGSKILLTNSSNYYLYYSSDSGSTWSTITNALAGRGYAQISDDGARLVYYTTTATGGDATVGVSTDAGANWTVNTIATGYTILSNNAGLLCNSSCSSMVSWSGGNNKVYSSSNYGATWVAKTNLPSSSPYDMDASADLSVLLASFPMSKPVVSINGGTSWVNSNGNNNYWTNGLVDSTGAKMFLAGMYEAGLEYSTNSGVSWSEVMYNTNRYYNDIAASNNGTSLLASVDSAYTFYSTNSGSSWSKLPVDNTSHSWTGVGVSSNGTKMAAAQRYYLWYSGNSGSTWAKSVNYNNYWKDVKVSGDGTKIVAGLYTGGVYVFSGGVSSPAVANGIGTANLWNFAISDNGSKMIAIKDNASVWYSSDSGSNWTQASFPVSTNINKVEISGDGQRAVIASNSGVYFSANSGATWVKSTTAPALNWSSIAMTNDGAMVAASAGNTPCYVYVSGDGGNTWVNQTLSNSSGSINSLSFSGDGNYVYYSHSLNGFNRGQ
jgi:hypothetical protein